MHIQTYKTPLINSEDNLLDLIDTHLPLLEDEEILVITSKIVSLTEGSFVFKKDVSSKKELIKHCSDAYFNLEDPIPLTIKNGLLIPFAGIDESNTKDLYILHPKNAQRSANEIWNHLRNKNPLKKIGVLITDSHSTLLRRGVIGIGLGFCGFKPLYSYIGKPDCFENPLHTTQINVVDALAAASVFCMGEGNEQTPFAIIKQAPKVEFEQNPPSESEVQSLFLSMEEDLHAPLFRKEFQIVKENKLCS